MENQKGPLAFVFPQDTVERAPQSGPAIKRKRIIESKDAPRAAGIADGHGHSARSAGQGLSRANASATSRLRLGRRASCSEAEISGLIRISTSTSALGSSSLSS